MPRSVFGKVCVILCDWRGYCTWISTPSISVSVNEPIWGTLDAESQEAAKTALSRVVALREIQEIEVTDRQGNRYRGSLSPMVSPELAVCIVCSRIPPELARLAPREIDCMQLLAQGLDTRTIAKSLDVSPSTVHTMMRRSKEKLGLPTLEALICFAARNYSPEDVEVADETAKNKD